MRNFLFYIAGDEEIWYDENVDEVNPTCTAAIIDAVTVVLVIISISDWIGRSLSGVAKLTD